MTDTERPIVFFDGHCGLCNRTVDWILRHDSDHVFVFAPLQGDTARGLFAHVPEKELMRSMWLSDEGRLYRRSGAFFRVCRRLPGAARMWSALAVLPRFLTDWGYDLVSRSRYKVWGRTDACRVPTPEERAYFLP